MSTQRPSILRAPRKPSGILQSLLVAGTLGACFLGCSFGWDGYDPRLNGAGGGGAAATSTGESASTSGAGGGSTTSATTGVTTSSSSTGVTTTTTSSSTSGTGGDPSTATTGVGGGSTSSSGSTGGGGSEPTHCGGMNVLADEFPGGDPDELWNLYSNNTVVSETGGQGVLALPDSSMNGSWGEFDSRRAYDFRGDSLAIDVITSPNPATTGSNWFGIGYDKNYLQIVQKAGVLRFEYYVADVKTSLKTTPFNAVLHRHWRFREDGTNTFWETSSDGLSWTVMAQVASASLFPLDTMWAWFGAGTDGGEVSPGQFHVDHVNTGVPTGKWCAASSIQDDFTDPARATQWGRSWEDSPGMLAEIGGKLTVTLPANTTDSATYASSSAFDLTSSSVVIEVPTAVTSPDGSETRIGLDAPANQGIEMNVAQNHLHFSVEVLNNWQEIGSVLYVPAQHRWWRIRESANILYWETSPDGKAWVSQAELSPVPIPITALDLYVGSNGWNSHPTAGISTFDNLNLPPP